MAIPDGIGTIDTMIGFPHGDMKAVYEFITRQTRDRESKEEFEFPAEYMFKQVPEKEFVDADDPVSVTVDAMDRVGIAQGMIGVDEISQEAMRRFPGRFFASAECDPHAGVEGLRRLRRLKDEFDIKAVGCFPAGTFPQVPINDKLKYPIYVTCCELDIPIFCCAGVSGPRLKMNPQRVELIDEVMYDFPELVFVTRHGCEPWADLAVKLMIKWPNLYYSTSAFAPKYYPKAIIDYANTRGAHKVIYAGYFPMGLSLDRIHSEMPNVPFKDEVWPGFLRDNAARILRL